MQLRFDQLPTQLGKPLPPVWVVAGDEPWQQREATDLIRARARAQGFDNRVVLEAVQHFKWETLTAEAASLSLFAERKLIDLRIPNGKPGTEGSAVLVNFAERPPPDTLLLVTLPKLDASQRKAKWLTSLEKAGVALTLWPIEGRDLLRWLEQQMLQRGLQPQGDTLALLADRTEGNLLAASQELDKLLLLQGPGPVSPDQLLAATSDSARFDVFKLVDAALLGKPGRALRVLGALQGEGLAEPIVLWALAREVRMLCTLRYQIDHGTPAQQAMNAQRGLWRNRHALVGRGLQRLSLARLQQLLRQCALADRAIKGRSEEDPWLVMGDILVGLAGSGGAIPSQASPIRTN